MGVGSSAGNIVNIVKTPIFGRCQILFFFLYIPGTSYFVSSLPKTYKSRSRTAGCCVSHPTILITFSDSSWYVGFAISSGFIFFNKKEIWAKRWGSWRPCDSRIPVKTTSTKWKMETSNTLSRRWMIDINFVWPIKRKKNLKIFHHFVQTDWFWVIWRKIPGTFFFNVLTFFFRNSLYSIIRRG